MTDSAQEYHGLSCARKECQAQLKEVIH